MDMDDYYSHQQHQGVRGTIDPDGSVNVEGCQLTIDEAAKQTEEHLDESSDGGSDEESELPGLEGEDEEVAGDYDEDQDDGQEELDTEDTEETNESEGEDTDLVMGDQQEDDENPGEATDAGSN
ncbi:hypothetical protein Back11_25140 [Paenibacillus baekrokdamisoli]|uniref:Uncharacterized protein n=2 Tax=Paenibacillus baekrokdamisoli TaxID=1712516 RepID=A0A3G9JDU8_9BACL|nr:hypothetical protein [Paenibacillus baekrokdamisoli]BBH21169.1 hypothetical protein Back11_25140 [Paenibacillus baekrokdamisoli]